ncbi:DUF2262 domain-containing protein [Fluviicola sp.]|uniref:DUF2262 domain-containing protein n=1 Tax=Fluviicola sp. TaxID=1917219 RepID=UPI0031DD990E
MNTTNQSTGFPGIWKLKSITKSGGEVHTSMTHLVIYPELLWEYYPDHVYYEGDQIGNSYSLNWKDGIGHLEVATGRGRSFCYFVTVDGNSLRMKLGSVFGDFPKDNGDGEDGCNIYRYERETDPEFITQLSHLPEKLPVLSVEHPVLGRLIYDSNYKYWETTLSESPFEDTVLSIHVKDGNLPDDSFFDAIVETLKKLSLDEVREFAGEQLLELKNESWLDEDENELTQQDFTERLIQVETITYNTDGSLTIWFDDNDLFWGHGIAVELDEHLNCTEANI